MNNFNFYNPTRIIFGKDTISKLSKLIEKDKRVLIIYGGGSIKKNGVYDQMIKALGDREVFEFSGIEPNPRYKTCMKCVEYIKENNVDFLLPVGGGSVIDATKFISAAYYIKDNAWSILETGGRNIEKALPFGTVLTLPATGSEMNKGSVITNGEKNLKLSFHSEKCFPVFSILDPQTTFSLPWRQVGNGIVDTFVHVMEQYLTNPVNNQISDRFAESILITLLEEAPKLKENPMDYDTRANLMWAATMGLNGLIACGVPEDWSTHLIGHELTAFHNIDHAITLAIVLPGVMRRMKHEKHDKLIQYAERVFGIKNIDSEAAIEEAIQRTEEFFSLIDVPIRLSEVNLDKNCIEPIVKRMEERGWNIGENGSITPDIIREILISRL
ncbi:MAG: iron-containing alcohol dehydrogenase [Bacteroidales bacterium]